MKKTLLLLTLPILFLGKTQAQEPDSLFLGLPPHHQAVTTSPFTFFVNAFLITYEHSLPHRSSLEVELGAQGFRWKETRGRGAVTRPGLAATVGYKFYLPLGSRSLAMARAGSIPRTSFYLKPRLALVHQWSSYDTYLGNNGWDIVTQRTTLRENTLSAAFIAGYQFVSRHGFVLSPYFGYSVPLWLSGPFHTAEQPGTTAAYLDNTTFGLKLGCAF